MKEKLICKKCQGTKWINRGGVVLTSYPAIYVTDYECKDCGNMYQRSVRGKLPDDNPQEVFLDKEEL
jgi:hypothetical protein